MGFFAGCGEDEILTRAREEAASGGAGGQHGEGVPEEPPPAPPGTPQPGEAGTAVAVVPGEPTPGDPGAPPPGDPGAPPPGDPGVPPPGDVGAPTPGIPDAPKPGIPVQPKPGQPGEAMVITGPSVTVTGKVEFPAWRVGSVRIDAFDGDHSKHGTQPGIVATTKLDRPGDFTLTVAQGVGKIYIEASIDEDADGKPGPQDPQGRAERYPVTVGADAVTGLRIVLTKQPPPPGGGKDKGRPDDF